MSKPNNLESLWMPFTPNKTFKKDPRIIVRAKDMHFTSEDNRQILDGTAGLWCVNAGHGRKKIQEAVTQQIEELDYSPPCLLYTSPSPRDRTRSRMPSSA